MINTIEAEVDVDGIVRLMEPVRVTRKTRALVTFLEESTEPKQGNGKQLLEILRNNRLEPGSRLSAEEIEAQITEARESWD